ncbi:hypothetical protein ACPOL_6388 [Acidisarcina polymorpha]|uniref:Uncharacterized protein n=1 Tax=Acidisarcina polymorpha TaxID=2211140 RepID=A0A2Z5G9F3_9BACT|nr:hypothetical protein ACPOL_6388 [Acidisarcina polymorpha]
MVQVSRGELDGFCDVCDGRFLVTVMANMLTGSLQNGLASTKFE